MAESLPLVMTPADVQKILGISKNTCYEVFRSKNFPAFRIGKQFRVRQDKFWDWVAQVERVV